MRTSGFVHDPNRIHLRKGLRAALVVPIVVVAGLQISTVASLFASFAAFATLVFADFSGERRRVVRAYVVLTVGGVAAVAIGTAIGGHVAVAAATLLAVAFTIRFAGCYGGYVVGATAPLLLAFVLSVMTPEASAASDRIGGWLIGSVVAVAAALVAPVRPGRPVHDGVSARCGELAAALRTTATGGVAAPLDRTRVLHLREQLAASPSRPVSPSARAASFTDLLDAVGRATLLTPGLRPPGEAARDEEVALAHAAADLLDATAATLQGGPAGDPTATIAARARHRDALADLVVTTPPRDRGPLVSEIAATASLRIISSLAVMASVAAAAVSDLAVAVPEGSGATLHPSGARAFLHRAAQTARFHLSGRSARLRNSARAAVALTLSLVIARVGGVDHGFWVVLGTMLVLRSSAADTEESAKEALAGTLVGFVVASVVTVVVGDDSWALWVLLPFATFAAGWAPGALGAGAGQASFTVFVVVLFNSISPAGIQTAVTRLEDVALGAGVAVVAGFVFWPRGSEAILGPAVARHYRAARDALTVLAAEHLGTPLGEAARANARARLLATRADLDETFDDLVADRRVDVELADRVAVLTPPAMVELAVATFAVAVPDVHPDHSKSPDRRALEARAFEVQTGFEAVADALDSDAALEWQPAAGAEPAVVPPDDDALRVLELVWLGVWLDTLEQSLAATAGATVAAVSGMPARWWG